MLQYYTVQDVNAEVVDMSARGDSYQGRTLKKSDCKGQKLKRRLRMLLVDQM